MHSSFNVIAFAFHVSSLNLNATTTQYNATRSNINAIPSDINFNPTHHESNVTFSSCNASNIEFNLNMNQDDPTIHSFDHFSKYYNPSNNTSKNVDEVLSTNASQLFPSIFEALIYY